MPFSFDSVLTILNTAIFNIHITQLLYVLLILIIGFFSKSIIFSIYKKIITFFAKYTKNDLDELILEALLAPFRVFYTIFIIYFASHFLKFDYFIQQFIDKIYDSIIYMLLSWACFIIIDLLREKLNNSLRTDAKLRKEIINFIIKFLKTIIIIVACSVLLSLWGYNVSGIIASLGIGGLAFALAAKDSASNLFGSLVVIWDKPFSYGDWIIIDDYEGTVIEIGLRSTTIRTFDNALVTIPNSILAMRPIKNFSKRKYGRRIKFNLGFTYSSTSKDLKNFITQFKNFIDKHPKTSTNMHLHKTALVSQKDLEGIKDDNFVVLNNFNDSSIDILVYCFSTSVNWNEWLDVKAELMFEIIRLAKINNLEFAYPSQSIYVEKTTHKATHYSPH